MSYCNHCGKKLVLDDAEVCPHCGGDLSHIQSTQTTREVRIVKTIPHKSPGTAAFIAFIGAIFGFPGIGHIYVGRIGRGIAILLSGFALYALTLITIFGTLGSAFGGRSALPLFQAGGIITVILIVSYLGLLIWQIFNARSCAKKHNKQAELSVGDP